jgi:purine nucleoside permease
MSRERPRLKRTIAVVFLSLIAIVACEPESEQERIEVRVVVVTMFERGDVDDDEPGELQLWVQRLGLDTEYDFSLGQDVLRMNDDGVMAILVGGGIPNATASMMALGLDERFDLTKAYWLVAGIAGADPEDLSLGSAAWAQHVVDGDLMYEIDAREIPESWPYGMVPLGVDRPTTNPDDLDDSWAYNTIAYSLNAGLVEWAYSLTKDIDLGDAPGITAFRENYKTYPEAQRPPFVTIGDTMSSSTYWHGALMNQWANDWLRLYRGDSANFMTSNMEDSGTLTALHRLHRNGLVDKERVLVLRTASNFTMPPEGQTAQWSKKQPYPDNGRPSFESAFIVGNVVVQALLEDWDEYRSSLPTSDAE